MKRQLSHAIVIGGSMAGLVTSRVLADHFDQVTLIERDYYPDKPISRKGVPQGHHVHLLLAKGRHILNQLFPDLDGRLAQAGAPEIDATLDYALRLPYGWIPRYRSQVLVRTGSRPLLEWHVYRCLAQNQRVCIREGTQVVDLTTTPDKTAVTGVQVVYRDENGQGTQSGPVETIEADLVVDTSGRNSQASKWLETMGYPTPKETVVDSFLGYASGWYEPPENHQSDWRMLAILPRYPDNKRGGMIYPVEDGKWIVLMAGVGREYPPTDPEGFLEFSRHLVEPGIYESLKEARPISPIYSYRRTANFRRHYEQLSRFPERFIALGDSVCAFNPYYGQGMTVCALGAMILDEVLCQHPNGDLTGMSLKFQKRLAKVNENPWLLAMGEDIRWPTTQWEGTRSAVDKLIQKYMDGVLLLAIEKPEVCQAFMEIIHMLKPPTNVMTPRIALQVMRQAITARFQPQPNRAHPPYEQVSGKT